MTEYSFRTAWGWERSLAAEKESHKARLEEEVGDMQYSGAMQRDQERMNKKQKKLQKKRNAKAKDYPNF